MLSWLSNKFWSVLSLAFISVPCDTLGRCDTSLFFILCHTGINLNRYCSFCLSCFFLHLIYTLQISTSAFPFPADIDVVVVGLSRLGSCYIPSCYSRVLLLLFFGSCGFGHWLRTTISSSCIIVGYGWSAFGRLRSVADWWFPDRLAFLCRLFVITYAERIGVFRWLWLSWVRRRDIYLDNVWWCLFLFLLMAFSICNRCCLSLSSLSWAWCVLLILRWHNFLISRSGDLHCLILCLQWSWCCLLWRLLSSSWCGLRLLHSHHA